MNNFIFYNPTRLLFGKGMINQLTQQIPADKRIMITFGGGSVRTGNPSTRRTLLYRVLGN